MKATLKATPEFYRLIDKLKDGIPSRVLNDAAKRSLRIVEPRIRQATPVWGGTKWNRRIRQVVSGGTLKDNIRTHVYKAKKNANFDRKNAVAFVAYDRKHAPHDHLVEFGTKGRRTSKKGMMGFAGYGAFAGKRIKKKSVAKMPANPFFVRTTRLVAPGAINVQVAVIKKFLKRKFK